jgi:hypothetical protein
MLYTLLGNRPLFIRSKGDPFHIKHIITRSRDSDEARLDRVERSYSFLISSKWEVKAVREILKCKITLPHKQIPIEKFDNKRAETSSRHHRDIMSDGNWEPVRKFPRDVIEGVDEIISSVKESLVRLRFGKHFVQPKAEV